MKYAAIAADLDGTLLNTDKILTPRTRAALERLIAAGVHFIPATGRPYQAMPAELRSMPGVQYAIVSNGVAVYDVPTNTPLFADYLPADFVPCLLDAMADEAVDYECMHLGHAYVSQSLYDRLLKIHGDTGVGHYFLSTRTPLADLDGFMRAHAAELDAVDVRLPLGERERIRAKIEAACPPIYITGSDAGRLEISNPISGKHRALERLCAHIGITPAQVVAFGDNDNDAEMLRAAGLGVAVGNATDVCRAAADRVTASCDEDGVAVMLEELFGL